MEEKDDLEYIGGENVNKKNSDDAVKSGGRSTGSGKEKKENRKKLPLPVRIIIGILIGLIVICIVAACVFFAMRSSGKRKLYSGANSSAPDMGNMFTNGTDNNNTDAEETSSGKSSDSENESKTENGSTASETDTTSAASSTESANQSTSTASGETTVSTEADNSGYVYQAGDVSYNGHIYRYNSDILTFLVLGIDQTTTVPVADENTDYWQGGQSDAIFLFVMNPHNKKLSVLAVNRNSMTDVDMYDRAGNYVKTTLAQVCVQHGYGNGGKQSCERARQTISEMLYNLPIHGYVSIRLGAVTTLNDAVGGVDVTLPSDFPQYGWTAGSTVHLSGDQAYNLIRYRDQYQFDSATTRLGNEKAFLSGFVNKVFEKTKSDVTFPVSLYQTISNYVVTDVSVDEMSYLASELIGYAVSDMKVYSVPGQTIMGKKFEEYYIDEAALKAQMIEIFYELVK